MSAAAEDEASGALWNAGCAGLTIQTTSERGLEIVSFFENPDEHLAAVREIAETLGGSAALVEIPDVDWVKNFRETFTAFDVPPFRVVPEWDVPRHDKTGVINLIVDPGRAFGTGTHESTQLCLRALGDLASSIPRDARVLDIGCGTSILAIAAHKLGAARVVACDIDDEATRSSVQHAARNGVNLSVVQSDVTLPFRAQSFDLVFANLMAGLLRARAEEISTVLRIHGQLVLAGILISEIDEVSHAFEELSLLTTLKQGEWASLVFRKMSP